MLKKSTKEEKKKNAVEELSEHTQSYTFQMQEALPPQIRT